MTVITQELAFIINLSQAAIFHKNHCQQEDCNVTLYQLKQTARFIVDKMRNRVPYPADEIKEANKIINEMPII